MALPSVSNASPVIAPTKITDNVFQIHIEEAYAETGETIMVPFFTRELFAVGGCQFTIAFDTDVLSFEALEGIAASAKDFQVDLSEEGYISTVWVFDTDSAHQPEKDELTTLFYLIFSVRTNTLLSQAIQLSNQHTGTEAYLTNGSTRDVSFVFVASIATQAYTLQQNQPNPFTHTTRIRFSLPSRMIATLRVFDTYGRTFWQIQSLFDQGAHELDLDGQALPPGFLYYTLETELQSETKKMLLLK